jgi:reactive intermediate/imine deaminase
MYSSFAIFIKEVLMEIEIISPSDVFDTRKKYGYGQAVRVGNTIYLAGQVAWDETGNVVGKGDIVAQIRQIYENIRRILAALGTTMNNIVKMTIFCKDVREFIREASNIREVGREYFGHHYAASTCIQIAGLWDPEMLLEIEVTAVID